MHYSSTTKQNYPNKFSYRNSNSARERKKERKKERERTREKTRLKEKPKKQIVCYDNPIVQRTTLWLILKIQLLLRCVHTRHVLVPNIYVRSYVNIVWMLALDSHTFISKTITTHIVKCYRTESLRVFFCFCFFFSFISMIHFAFSFILLRTNSVILGRVHEGESMCC